MASKPNKFILQLSHFDTSHRSEVPGTSEILIPLAARPFFPALTITRRKYPDAYFEVNLINKSGKTRHEYRIWDYEERAVGTKINELRLRTNHDTIDQMTPGGGDLLVMDKLPAGSSVDYEVSIISPQDPKYHEFLSQCQYNSNGKRWGLI